MASSSEQLAAFVSQLRFEDIPSPVIADAKMRFTDIVGVCLLATRSGFAQVVREVVCEQGGRAEATVLGFGDSVPACQAALVNGSLGHGVEYDDTHAACGLHPSCFAVPTALAVAERQSVGGREAIVAAIAGWEMAIRLGRAGIGYMENFQGTAVIGTFAAAIIAGKLLGLSTAQLANAMGIAGSWAAGTRQWLDDVSWIKWMHGGWPSHAGITAALLAQKGFTGPRHIFEGRRGTLNAYAAADHNAELLTADLGSVWETPGTTFKIYPCGMLSQSAMYAARGLQAEHLFRADDVERIECFVPSISYRVLCDPREVKIHPRDGIDTFYSLPWALAVALLDDELTLDSFSEERRFDQQVLALAQRVNCTLDEGIDVAQGQPARVVIFLRDGRTFERYEVCRGSPLNPIGQDEVERKFRNNVARILTSDRASKVSDMLWRLDELPDVGRLMALCVQDVDAEAALGNARYSMNPTGDAVAE